MKWKEVEAVQSLKSHQATAHANFRKIIHLLNGPIKKGASEALTQQPPLWEV